jgi:hypothetical protein
MEFPQNETIVFPWAPDVAAGGQIAGIMNAVHIGVLDLHCTLYSLYTTIHYT